MKPHLMGDYLTIRFNSFASNGKAILFAGFKPEIFNNWVLAFEYAAKHDKVQIQNTQGGIILNENDTERGKRLKKRDYILVWKRASTKYSLSIEGSVKTFVCGANDESIFRTREIQAMFHAKHIADVNGVLIEHYAQLRRAALKRLRDRNETLPQDEKLTGVQRHLIAINTVFRAIAMNEIREDLSHAQTKEERDAVLKRVEYVRGQHKDEMGENLNSKGHLGIQGLHFDGLEEMAALNPHLADAIWASVHVRATHSPNYH
jgi:hypothetical protein